MPHARHIRAQDFRLLAAIFNGAAAANGYATSTNTHTLELFMRSFFSKLGKAVQSRAVQATAMGCVAIVATHGWSKATAALVLTAISAALSRGDSGTASTTDAQ